MNKFNNYELRLFHLLYNNLDLILNNPYITGMGYGLKRVNNKVLPIPTITFLVKEKLPPLYIYPKYIIPKYINSVLTDVIEDNTHEFYSKRARPAYAGLSITNATNFNNYGTISYAVTDKKTKNNLYILSTAHTLLPSTFGTNTSHDIIQPSYNFGGVPPKNGKQSPDYIGNLSSFVEFKWKDDPKKLTPADANEYDAAIAYVGANTPLTRKSLLAPYFKVGRNSEITKIKNIGSVKIGDKIWTVTANSIHRIFGEVKLINVVKIIEEEKRHMLFTNQIMVSNALINSAFSKGDSGALGITEGENKVAFGILISGSGQNALFSPIEKIFDRFSLQLAISPDGEEDTIYQNTYKEL